MVGEETARYPDKVLMCGRKGVMRTSGFTVWRFFKKGLVKRENDSQ